MRTIGRCLDAGLSSIGTTLSLCLVNRKALTERQVAPPDAGLTASYFPSVHAEERYKQPYT